MCNVYAPEEDVSENDGNPEPDADELQCQDGDLQPFQVREQHEREYEEHVVERRVPRQGGKVHRDAVPD